MPQQITFYKKNHIDLDRPNPTITITDSIATNTGQANVDLMRNRENDSGWLTTNSTDAANTEILIDLGDHQDIDVIMLLKMNFKDFDIDYWDIGSGVWVTYESVTNNTNENYISENTVNTNQIRITINSTQTADADKVMRQLIITEKYGVGQFEGWPVIRNPRTSRNKRVNKTLSGRSNVVQNRGSFSVSLSVDFLTSDSDLTLIENIFLSVEGVLIHLSGGDESQFKNSRIGYRLEDIYLVKATNELENSYEQGIYSNGIKVRMNLEESLD